jgi:hypothetical protein
MTFVGGLEQFAAKAVRNEQAVFVTSVAQMRDSIKFGSALTGAPPMPVAASKYDKAGALRDSVEARYPDPNTAIILTTKWYAPDVEDNPRGVQFSSGAPHGWKLTAAAFSRVVDHNAQRLGGK